MLSSSSFIKTYPLCTAVPELLPKYKLQFNYENKMDVLCIYEENSTVIKKKEFLFTKRFRGTIITCYLFHGINNNDIYIYDDMKQFCNHNKQMTCNVKLLHMKNIMEQHNTSIILYFPIMWNNQSHENDLYKNKNIHYTIHKFLLKHFCMMMYYVKKYVSI
jgi:hypothetical protein